MGNVLLDYNPEVPLNMFCDCEEAKDIIRNELFHGPEWVMGDRGDIPDKGRYELVKRRALKNTGMPSNSAVTGGISA